MVPDLPLAGKRFRLACRVHPSLAIKPSRLGGRSLLRRVGRQAGDRQAVSACPFASPRT